METRSAISQIDKNVSFTPYQSAVTLICANERHAMIVIERVNFRGEYSIELSDFGGRFSIQKDKNTKKTDIHVPNGLFGYDAKGRILIRDLEGKEVTYSMKSETWVITRENEKLISESIKADAQSEINFSILGEKSIVSAVATIITNKEHHNCITWAVSKLKMGGINLPLDHINFLTHTNAYTSVSGQPAMKQSKNYDINDLCVFAKNGDVDAIKRYFPASFNINQLTRRACTGTVEMHLGQYTPLMLAAAYGQKEAVYLLIARYQADVTLSHGKYNALYCAQKTKWLKLFDAKPRPDQTKIIEILEYKSGKGNKLPDDFKEEMSPKPPASPALPRT